MFTAQPYIPLNEPRLRSIPFTPALGSELLIVVPQGYYWDPLSLNARLVTSAVVANRVASIVFDDGANQVWIDTGPNQVASATVDYILGEAIARDVTLPAIIKLSNPGDLRMQSGWQIRTSTLLLDVGDRWTATLTVREWQTNITGPRNNARYRSLTPGAMRRPGRSY